MLTSDINDEIKQTAEYAIKIAMERFGKQLDYTENSLPNLEYLIEQAYQQSIINRLGGKGKEDTAQSRTASVWGSYLGELIRGKLGGTWLIEDSKWLLLINDHRISPIDYIKERITGQLQGNVKQYFDGIVSILSSQPTPNLPKSTYAPNQSKIQEPNKIKPHSSTWKKVVLPLLSILIIGGLASIYFGFIYAKQQAEALLMIETNEAAQYQTQTASLIMNETRAVSHYQTETAQPSATPMPPTTPDPRSYFDNCVQSGIGVRYVIMVVEGNVNSVSLTWQNDAGGTNQGDYRVPYCKTFTGFNGGDFLYISAQISDPNSYGIIECRIYDKNNIIAKASASGFPSIATCSTSK